MEKSIFATHLKEIMKTKDKIETRNGKTKIVKKYTQTDLANDLGYSVDTVKSWTKSNGTLPTLETLKTIAELFNVDTAYLLGEQPCKHHEEQTICDVTMLSEESATVLRYLDIDSSDILSEFITHPQFEFLLSTMIHFIRFSQNESFVSYDKGIDEFEHIDMDITTQKALKKYVITDTFSKILDDLFEYHNDLEFEIIKLKDLEIDSIWYAIEQQDDISFIESLIDEFQTKLKKISPKDPLCTYSHQYFIENIETIAKQRP